MTTRTAPARRGVQGDPLSPEQFVRFRDLIEERCGIHFDDSQRASLSASLRARMQQLGLEQVDEYYDRLCRRTPEDGFRKLINLVTITETCFFRDPSQFRLLRRRILPTLLAERGAGERRTLRIWSAGCSTGEEAYSIALTCWDMGLHLTHPDWTLEIVGTDVNTEALEAARRGLYSARALRNVEGRLLERYFRPEGRRFRLHDGITRSVRFETANLKQVPLPRPAAALQDIVFCKNVAIYFRPEMTRRLVRGLHESLEDGGFLLLGHSESLWQMDEGFALIEDEGAFCYRKLASPGDTAAPRDANGHRAGPAPGSAPPPPDAATGEYDRCLMAFRAEEWTQAEQLLAALIQSSPAFVPAHLLLGGVYVHRGRYPEALEQAARVLRLNDLEPRAHLLLGMLAARSGRSQEAVEALRRALYLDDSLALAHFWLGNLYRDRGDIARARLEYQSVIHHWERQTLELTEVFASDLSAGQLVTVCRRSLQGLQTAG